VTLSIVDFLNARLAEDQAAAEAARDLMDEPWKIFPEGPEEENYSGEYRISNGITVAGHVEEAKASHIARHDPARVLREVAAKRAVIEDHQIKPVTYPEPDDDEAFDCERCHFDRDEGVYGFGYCPTLKALAAVYSSHHDYRKEWAK
jgi:hypothetical protein